MLKWHKFYKQIKFSFILIFIFFKLFKKSNLPFILKFYLYFSLINYLYIKFLSNILFISRNKKNFNNCIANFFHSFFNKKKAIRYFSGIKDRCMNATFKNNNYVLFFPWKKRNKYILNYFKTTLNLIFFNKVKKNMLNLLLFDRSINKKKWIIPLLHKKSILVNANNFKEYIKVFLLPINLKKNIHKAFVFDLKYFESIFFFKFIRRVRTIFFLFVFFLLLYWFNKLLFKINFKQQFIKIQNHCQIKFFNNLKILIGYNIKYIWLYSKIALFNFNINYVLYNNIMKN